MTEWHVTEWQHHEHKTHWFLCHWSTHHLNCSWCKHSTFNHMVWIIKISCVCTIVYIKFLQKVPGEKHYTKLKKLLYLCTRSESCSMVIGNDKNMRFAVLWTTDMLLSGWLYQNLQMLIEIFDCDGPVRVELPQANIATSSQLSTCVALSVRLHQLAVG